MKILLDSEEMEKIIKDYFGSDYDITSIRIIPGRSRGSSIEVEAEKITTKVPPPLDGESVADTEEVVPELDPNTDEESVSDRKTIFATLGD